MRSCERRWLATVPCLLLVACTAPRTPYAAGSDAGLHGANANVEPPSRGARSIPSNDLAAIDDTQFMNEVLANWFERDPIVRRKVLASHFHPDIHFIDHDGTFVGYEELEKFSDALQKRFPDGRFAMSGTPERVANGVRAFWTLGKATGMDFALFEGTKIKALYVFVHAPTP